MSEVRNVYDQATTDTYTETFPINASRQLVTKHVSDFIGRQGLQGSLIDFGCGTGEDAELFNGTDVTYFGNDLSHEMLAYGQAKGVTRTVASDLAVLPFADDSFEAGMSLWAAQYKPNLEETFAEWRRVLAADAPMLLVVPHPVYKFAKYSRDYFAQGQQWEEGLGIKRFNYYHSFGDYINALISSGFSIETIQEPQREASVKQYFGVPKGNIPHDLIIETRVEK